MSSEEGHLGSLMAERAIALLKGLTIEQRAAACFDFADSKERRTWFFTPTDHGGLPIADMHSLQQQAAFQLIATGLSAGGYATVALIMGAENILDYADGWFAPRDGRRGRDPMMYQISIFGEPGQSPWGWRVGGHHVSLHYTVADDSVSATPCFFGLDPSETQLIGGHSSRPLAPLEDLGRELVNSLDDVQRSMAVISDVPPLETVTGNRPEVKEGSRPPHLWEVHRTTPPQPRYDQYVALEHSTVAKIGLREEHLAKLEWARTPKGLRQGAMTAKQRDLMAALLEQYVGRLPDALANRERERLARIDQELHFAWAGSTIRHNPHYYRIQGPRFLVEYDSFHRDGGHVHAVWRDPVGDFGSDILARHVLADH